MQLDILAIGAHPDDVELCCGGTLAKAVKLVYKTDIVDLSEGGLGTRGNNKELHLSRDGIGMTKHVTSQLSLYHLNTYTLFCPPHSPSYR